MGLRPNRSQAGDIAAQQSLDAQAREQERTKNARVSLLADQLGQEDRDRIRQFGTRSLLAGTGGSTPMSSLIPNPRSKRNSGAMAGFGSLFSQFGLVSQSGR